MSVNSDDDAAMKELMGFSSFGNHKKARHDHDHQRASHGPQFTSSNAIPLGQRTQPGVQKLHREGNVPRKLNVFPDPRASAGSVDADSRGTSFGQEEQDSTYFTTTSAPNQIDDITDATPMEPSRPDTNNRDHRPRQTNDPDEIAYTNPHTGISFTRRQLDEYSRGKEEILPDGTTRKVFFKPSFVEEGMWDRWENAGGPNLNGADEQVKARERLESERGERLGSMLAPATSAIGGI